MARKSKLTDETTKAIVEALSLGSTIKDACAYAGISWDSYNRYINCNADFADAIKKAQSNARISSIGRIRKAGKDGQWQADAWFLERSDPEHWARRDRLIIDVDPRILKQLGDKLKDAGLSPSDVFEQMIRELSSTHVDSTDTSTDDA